MCGLCKLENIKHFATLQLEETVAKVENENHFFTIIVVSVTININSSSLLSNFVKALLNYW